MAVPSLPGALLLCLDLQPSLLKAIPQADLLVQRVRLTLSAAAGLGLDAAFTEQAPDKLGPTLPELTAIRPESPRLAKTSFSALGSERVAALLRERDIEHLLLCGIETSICVYQTAIAALNQELQVTVLADAVGGRREGDGVIALSALARAGVHILPVETVLYSLAGHATHPFLKTLTSLVKSHG